MSSPKYYMQCEEEATYPDSTCGVFYDDQPFDTIEEAKHAADANARAAYGTRTVYECRDNILTPILIRGWSDMIWEPISGGRRVW